MSAGCVYQILFWLSKNSKFTVHVIGASEIIFTGGEIDKFKIIFKKVKHASALYDFTERLLFKI